jgi:signal transduction histidine kinase
VADLMRAVAESKKIALDVKADKGLSVEGSSNELKKVLINLVKNSIEACIEGDSIRMDASKTKDGYITVRVIDTGSGIDAQNREKIFRPYFTTKSNGTGLGLALSHRIISDHDGTLEYDNNPGGGSVFIITLPAFKEVEA